MDLISVLQDLLAGIESAVVALGPSPWLLVAVLVLSFIDGFFPPVPSESIVIAAAVLAVTGDVSALYLVALILAAAFGAFCGDLIAYWIGSRIPVERLRMFNGRRGQAVLAYAGRALAARGSTVILTGRFIPVGRVAVNMTAGAVHYPMPRFVPIVAIASTLWAGCSTAMGIGVGQLFRDNPLLAMAVGICAGVGSGLLIDRLLRLGGGTTRAARLESRIETRS